VRRFLVFAALVMIGCGRHATQADCETILDRMVVVKLKQKNITDPESVQKMQGDLRKDAESDFPSCVGRRITDSAMACIKKADTQEAIVKCLR
jgi:chorismate mutase